MAKNIDLKVRIKGAAKAKKGLGGVDNSLKSLGKSAMAAGAAFFGARAIIGGIKSVVALEREQTLAVKKLETALGKNVDALLKQASALQQVTTFGDETIIQAQAMLAMFIKDEEQLKKATIATLDLAAAKGMDLVAAADLVGKSVGSSTNALARYGVSATGAAGSTERLNSIVDGMTQFFGGQATAIVDTMAGSLDQMSNAAGDVGEVIGSALAPAVMKVSKFLKSAAESVGNFLQRSTETSLETTIRELQSLGVNTLNLELAFSKAEAAKAKFLSVGLRGEEEISKNLNNSGKLRVVLLEQQAKMQADLLEQGTSEEELIRQSTELVSERHGVEITDLAKKAALRLEDIRRVRETLRELETQNELDQADLEIIQKMEAAKAQVLALEQAIEESKKNQASIPPTLDPVDGKPEVESLIMSEEQKASIRGEFNERFLEMTVGQNELQNIELQNATERFREAGIEEVEIAKFVAERKKAIDLASLNSKISSVGSLVGAFGQLNQASKGSALVSKRLAQGEAVMSTWVAVNKALAAGVPPWNIVQATAIGAMGLANVLKIEQQEFAQGGDFVTSGPQSILVGDNPGGRERVSVEPLSSPNINGPKGGITLNISAPLVDETVIDHIIPAIEKAQRNNLA